MTLEIQVLAWDRHKNMTGLKRLTRLGVYYTKKKCVLDCIYKWYMLLCNIIKVFLWDERK
jgi:hypothetical protein